MARNKFTKLQEAWLHDLETTKAKQGTGYLRSRVGWCCLGRACKVMGMKGIRKFPGEYEKPYFEFNGNITTLNSETMDVLNLNASGMGYLIALNDAMKPFKQIAAIMRQSPQDFFFNFRKEA